MKIQLGDRVKDRINGYAGIVTGRLQYINGCVQFGVSREVLDDKGSAAGLEWIDEQRLDVVHAGAYTPGEASEATVGGEQSTPPSRPRS